MKKLIYSLMLIPFLGMAQTDKLANGLSIPEKTPELKMLYEQSKQLEMNGTATEINANRLAIKQAWESVDPEVAALYKPVPAVESQMNWKPNPNSSKPSEIEEWESPMLIRPGTSSGYSMDVAYNDDIYIAGYENDYQGTQGTINLFLYKSSDGGDTFTKVLDYIEEDTGGDLIQIQALTMTGTTGNQYLQVLFINEEDGSGNTALQILGIDLNTYTIEYDTYILGDAKSFSADINYPVNTYGQRIFVTYTKPNTACDSGLEIFSARSTAGTYATAWVDQAPLNRCAEKYHDLPMVRMVPHI